ncbi:probable tubulin polyglutamylase ttll-15 [Chironomus tepperi]|uniref:probable tubulin polyglutamylase ttll-15 n=1 Tax=Chironomus tepperi TaxID=113505 RepID=UPI00391F3F47
MSEDRPEVVIQSSNRRWTICSVPVLIAVISVALIPFYSNIFNRNCNECPEFDAEESESTSPKYIVYDGINRTDILGAVDRVLRRMGLEKIQVKDPSNFPKNWNLLWSFKHQETLKDYINWSEIKYHQKINHFPGNYMLVSKSYLTTQDDFDFIPRGFLTSEDVREYAAQHPEKRFVLKLKSNRGVKLVSPSEMNFTDTSSLEDYFAQEYLEDPLLWNGYKFDFSIFVVITSVNPLRFYYYNKNVNLRFCLKPYSTENISDVDAYVIGTNHTSSQVFPYVKKYIDAGYTNKDAFENYIREIGGDLDHVWQQVENVIRSTVLTKEEYMIKGINRVKASKYSFFELYRFDMIFDKNLKLYLIEVNMSPNLLAVRDKIHNKFMFENVLYNLFNMIGVGTVYKKNIFAFPEYDVESMVAYHDAMTVKPEICLTSLCDENCIDDACKFCWDCLHTSKKYEMIQALHEQMNRGHFTRVFPVDKEHIDESLWEDITPVNKFYIEWFHEMCKKNKHFC